MAVRRLIHGMGWRVRACVYLEVILVIGVENIPLTSAPAMVRHGVIDANKDNEGKLMGVVCKSLAPTTSSLVEAMIIPIPRRTYLDMVRNRIS